MKKHTTTHNRTPDSTRSRRATAPKRREMTGVLRLGCAGCTIALWLTTAGVAAADCSAKWSWENPLPSGIWLSDVSFLDKDTGLAVGSPGIVVKTTDGGESWDTLRCGMNETDSDYVELYSVAVADANNVTAVGTFWGPDAGARGVITSTADGGESWSTQLIKPDDASQQLFLTEVKFTDANSGVAVGSEGALGSGITPLVLQTLDGGKTWMERTPNLPVGGLLEGLWFTSTSTGVAIGADENFVPLVLRTVDGGATWARIDTSDLPLSVLFSVFFTDPDNGWAAGRVAEGVGIFRTTDGGVGWSRLATINTDAFPTDLFFASDNLTGIVVGTNSNQGNTFYRTGDGGVTWELHENSSDLDLEGIAFGDDVHGTIVGRYGAVLRTIDGGANWFSQTSSPIPFTGGRLEAVDFIDGTTGIAVGGTAYANQHLPPQVEIVKTTDGGATWIAKEHDSPHYLMGIAFGDAQNAIAVGHSWGELPNHADGVILGSADGGEAWVAQQFLEDIEIPFDEVNLHDVSCTDANNCTVVGRGIRGIVGHELILRTVDGGATWVTQRYEIVGNLLGVSFVNANTGWTVGPTGRIRKTTDAGDTWDEQTSGSTAEFTDVFFLDESVGYLVGYDGPNDELTGIILKTADGGETWNVQEAGLPSILWDVSFIDSVNGMVVGEHGRIYRTTDGGETWILDPSGANHDLLGVAMTNTSSGVAVGELAAILRRVGDLAVNPPLVDFGPVLLGEAHGPLSVVLTNHSPDDVTVTEVSGPEAPFSADGGTCGATPFTLSPDEGCELGFSFAPTTAGTVEATVSLVNDSPESLLAISLRGIGSDEPLPITPDPLGFGGVVIGEEGGPLSATLANATAAAVEVSAVSVPVAPFVPFEGTCPGAPFTLEPFTSCTLSYAFHPTESGSFVEVVEVVSDASSSPDSLTLQGEGLIRELTITPGLLDFGAVPLGETAGPLNVTVTNSGQADVALGDVSAPGAPFELTEDTCEAVLPAEASCTLGYTFNPTTPGEASAEITIASNAPSSPDTVSLQGTGVGAVIEVNPGELATTLGPGQVETQPLAIANLGNEALEWEVMEGGTSEGQILWPTERATTTPQTLPPPVTTQGPSRIMKMGGADTAVSYPFSSSGGDVTVTHSESLDIFSSNTARCANDDGTTVENRFLRTFTLTDFNIVTAFDVTAVTFGVETLTGTVPITVNLYTLDGEFTYDNLTLIGTATEELSPQDLTLLTIPVTGTAPPGSTLVVEIEAPDLTGVARFAAGSNDLGETAPSYIASAPCGAPEPTPFADVGFPDVHLVMTVTGAVGDCELPGWLSVDPSSGSVPAGEDQMTNVTFDTASLDSGDYEADLCLASNDPMRSVIGVPVHLTVLGAELTFDPASLDFGDVPAGTTSPPQTVMLHNVGPIDATNLEIQIVGDGFDADASACGTTLPAAGGQCMVSVTFTPPALGSTEATLEASSDYGAVATVDLSGNGTTEIEAFVPIGLAVDTEEIISDANGVFEPGELVMVAPTWLNGGMFAQVLEGTASNLTGPEGPTYSLLAPNADYGEVESGQMSSCQATEVCYEMDIGPAGIERPARHWDATFDEALSDETDKTWTLHLGDSFADVPRESLFYPWIETLLHHRVTGGCADAAYCPADANARGQMAVFLLKASEGGDYQPPACIEGEEVFADVPFDSLFCPWIEELAGRGVTAGCGGGNYCPNASVNRDQMTVFLLKALLGSGYMPPACTGVFADVPCPSLFANWVEDLVARGVTAGCGGGSYCPANPVSRDQMAVFLSKTFGLELYGP